MMSLDCAGRHIVGKQQSFQIENSPQENVYRHDFLLKENRQILPGITDIDMVNYLLSASPVYSADEMRLDAQSQFISGCVHKVTAVYPKETLL